jgi:CRP-like cAMP-binding protein
MLIRLAQVCGRICSDGAVTLLKERLSHYDPDVRTQVMRSLSRCGYRAQGQETAPIQQQIESELEHAAWLLAASADLGQVAPLRLLQSGLADQLVQCRERVFLLLSFVYDAGPILRARDNLNHASAEKRAYALEVLDVTIAPEIKRRVLPLIEDLTPQERLRRLSDQFPQPHLGRDERLRAIVRSDGRLNAWARACAQYAQIKLSPSEHGECDMLSTIEKVIILKSVNIFAETLDEILADVAQVCEEVAICAGEAVFEKGDTGDSLYIIVSGKVRVHDGEHTLNFLGERDVFGEMALLDPEPRSASVTAAEDTQLLRLGQEPFFELMEDRMEVARGIIKVLSRHLRARVQDLADLRTRQGALAA